MGRGIIRTRTRQHVSETTKTEAIALYLEVDYLSHETSAIVGSFELLYGGGELSQVSQVTRAVSESACLVVDFMEYCEFIRACDKEVFHQSLKLTGAQGGPRRAGNASLNSLQNALHKNDLLPRSGCITRRLYSYRVRGLGRDVPD